MGGLSIKRSVGLRTPKPRHTPFDVKPWYEDPLEKTRRRGETPNVAKLDGISEREVSFADIACMRW